MTTISDEQLASFFHDLNFRFDTVEELDLHLANRFNVFRWLDREQTREVTLSSMIRELLDPKGTHGQRAAFLRSFLDIVGLGHVGIDPNAEPPRCEERTRNIQNSLRRIDIFLRPDKRFAIGIENKPRAADQPGWVKDYSDHLANKYGDGYLLVYLTADPWDPSGDADLQRAKELGGKFKNISYKKDIRVWLEACYQVCRADKVRSFLKDFIDYVKVMTETGMLSKQDLDLVTNYVHDQPGDKGFKVAYAVKEAWPVVVRRTASDFQAALEERLRTKFNGEWEIKRVPDSDLLQKEGLGFRVSKRQWQGRFAFSLAFAGSDCTAAFFGVAKGNASDTYVPSLKEKMDEGMGAGKQNRYWEWWSPVVDPMYREWNTPEAMTKLAGRGEALNYFAGLFEDMKQIAEPLINGACSAS